MTDGELTHMPYYTSISAVDNLAHIELMILGPRQLGHPIQHTFASVSECMYIILSVCLINLYVYAGIKGEAGEEEVREQ